MESGVVGVVIMNFHVIYAYNPCIYSRVDVRVACPVLIV